MITRPLPRPSILSSMCSMGLRGSSSKAEVEEDHREQARFQDGKISSGRKKSQGSNIGEMASEAKRSLDKSSEGSEEVFLDEAGE
ncbi:hypothetical protein Tco_0777428 [Tanacetum coccineum]